MTLKLEHFPSCTQNNNSNTTFFSQMALHKPNNIAKLCTACQQALAQAQEVLMSFWRRVNNNWLCRCPVEWLLSTMFSTRPLHLPALQLTAEKFHRALRVFCRRKQPRQHHPKKRVHHGQSKKAFSAPNTSMTNFRSTTNVTFVFYLF